MAKRNRSRRPARQAPFKSSKPIILVVAEGKVTETKYINTFAAYHKNSRVDVVVRGGAGVPKTIVEYAKELKTEREKEAKSQKDENIKFDEVWCVFDIDTHPDIPEAIQKAHSSDLRLAISNPCFELWLWLHFAPQPGIQGHKQMQKMLKSHIPHYEKDINFMNISSGYSEAVSRAQKLESDAIEEGEDGRNPTTGVWRLTESIRCGNSSE